MLPAHDSKIGCNQGGGSRVLRGDRPYPEAFRAAWPGYLGPVSPPERTGSPTATGHLPSFYDTNGEADIMGDLLIVLGLIFVAAIASGVLLPLLAGTPRTEEERKERDARLRDELAAWN